MKKNIFALLLAAILLLSGCNSWLGGHYASVNPFEEQDFRPQQAVLKPKNYEDIVRILINMIHTGQQSRTISMEQMQGKWREIVDKAVNYVGNVYPMGVYAIMDIAYQITENEDIPAMTVEIAYHRSIAEIGAVETTEDEDEIIAAIQQALRNVNMKVAFYVKNEYEIDFSKVILEYAMMYPQYVMEVPRVSMASYPKVGEERIVELNFSYDTNRTVLLQMQDQVNPIFNAAKIVSGEGTAVGKYTRLYSFLMNYHEYTIQTSITPAYSLLYSGIGDSKSFAMVYSAMCRQAGLDSKVISGTYEGKAWHWNMVRIDEEIYYIDLLQCREQGRFSYLTEDEMHGYVWENTVY